MTLLANFTVEIILDLTLIARITFETMKKIIPIAFLTILTVFISTVISMMAIIAKITMGVHRSKKWIASHAFITMKFVAFLIEFHANNANVISKLSLTIFTFFLRFLKF